MLSRPSSVTEIDDSDLLRSLPPSVLRSQQEESATRGEVGQIARTAQGRRSAYLDRGSD
jgi:hypothetical protein